MKHIILLASLTAAAVPVAPELSSADPYKKYSMQLDHARASIEMTKAAIEEVKEMNEAAIEEVVTKMEEVKQEAEEMKKKTELLMVVLETNNIEVPKDREQWFEDSIRTANMIEINKK